MKAFEWFTSWFRGWFTALFFSGLAAEEQSRQIAAHAERKAELLRLAARYREEGFSDLADELIRQAQELSLANPLGACQPVFAPVPPGPGTTPSLPALPAPPTPSTTPKLVDASQPAKKRRGRPPKSAQNGASSNHQPVTDINRTH